MTKMTFIGTIDKTEHHVTVEDNPDNPHLFEVSMDGKVYHIDAYTMQSEIVSALIDNKSYDLDLDRQDPEDPLNGHLSVRVRGRVLQLEMLDERRRKMKDAQMTRFSETGVSRIVSPMPGKILRVLVEDGQMVKEGDGLIVIEAMKMENEIRAPKAGSVKSILGRAGESVEGGALLMTVE